MNAIPYKRGVCVSITMIVIVLTSTTVHAKSLTFEQVFTAKKEAPSLHYQAVFTSKGVEHKLEAWRDGDRRVKRSIDEAIELYAVHVPGSADFHLSILDNKRRIHSQVDRTNLYRVGNFTDWYDLAYSLKYPKQTYGLTKVPARSDSEKPIQECSWYALQQEKRTTDICWSRSLRLPLLIQMPDGPVIWRVTSVEKNAIADPIFVIHDQGFVQNDVNKDIESD